MNRASQKTSQQTFAGGSQRTSLFDNKPAGRLVEMLERGYVPVSDKARFVKSLRAKVGKGDRFKENAGVWSVS